MNLFKRFLCYAGWHIWDTVSLSDDNISAAIVTCGNCKHMGIIDSQGNLY